MTAPQVVQPSRRGSGSALATPRLRVGRIRRLPLAAGLAFLLVSGCTGGEAGDAARSATPAEPSPAVTTEIPTPSASPTIERRNDADGNPIFDPPQETVPGTDLEGAKRAATDFIDAYFRGLQSGDATYLREHSEQGCEYCAIHVKEIEDTWNKGLRLSPDFTWDMSNVGAMPPDAEVPNHGVVLDWSASDYVLVDGAGDVIETYPGDENAKMLIALRRVPDGWRIVSVDIINDEFARSLREHYADVMG